LFSSCRDDCLKQQFTIENSENPKATGANYLISCSQCSNSVSLPFDPFRPALPSFVERYLTRGEKYWLALALQQAGFPKPWKKLKKDARNKLSRVISGWYEEQKKSYPPLVIEKAEAERDWRHESASQKWRLAPTQPELLRHGQKSERKYFYGFIRIDEGYTATEVNDAFGAWLRDHWRQTKSGGSPNWQARLNDLVVMRLWNRFPKRENAIKRVEHTAKLTTAGFKGCKTFWDDRRKAVKEKRAVEQRISKAANEEMSRAREDALKFFQTLFPSEIPLNYPRPSWRRKTWQQPEKQLPTS
jgi:hypothetical protein